MSNDSNALAARGRGAPTVAPGGTRRINVTLDALTEDRLRALGNGNLSAGARIAAEIASRR